MWVGDKEKLSVTFSHGLSDSSWIHLILQIKQIQYKIGKSRMFK